ncbi:esterase/lipase family protein [Streptomyces gobiensis]|uniref:esterase/lipase family protein n=1 Tax=Streptomyces gobiensis TaxID=2875706 RepID=UPI001E56B591|nr:alpha/beta fold hydrolase [Streptomyces gobiensis]UGY94092.1 alpha/beta fold hydrolase [Streptomyces gobiensis]
MRRRSFSLFLASAVATLTAVIALPPAAGASEVSPPGANDWSCKPTKDRPEPVILVHGTFENMVKNWTVLSPQLADAGYCVFALDYGDNATAPVADSAAELQPFVDRVLKATGARKADIVGHSQGGMMPRYYVKFLGGDKRVDDLIGIVPSNHGTTNPLAFPTGATVCPACADQMADSAFMAELNSGGDTVPGPHYTVITTKYDEVVTPYTSAFLDGPRNRVTNATLQDTCPLNTIEHDQAPNHPEVAQWVLEALERRGPADPGFQPDCVV